MLNSLQSIKQQNGKGKEFPFWAEPQPAQTLHQHQMCWAGLLAFLLQGRLELGCLCSRLGDNICANAIIGEMGKSENEKLISLPVIQM